MNDTLERHKAWGLWWECEGTGGHVEPKEDISDWVILVSVLLSLHSYQKGGRARFSPTLALKSCKNFQHLQLYGLVSEGSLCLRAKPRES